MQLTLCAVTNIYTFIIHIEMKMHAHHDHAKSFQFIFAVCILLCTHSLDIAYADTDVPPFAIDDAGKS